MKKILGISLVAMMAVTTARADIASKAYVDQREAAAVTTANTYTNTKIGTLPGNAANVGAAIGDLGENATVADAIAAAIVAAEGDAADAIESLDLAADDATGDGNVVSAVTQTDGQIAVVKGITAEETSNKVTSLSGSSTDTQYPSAKLVYDQLALKAADADLTAEVTRATAAETALGTRIDNLGNDYATDTELADGLALKQDTLTFDDAPTASSTNPVKSGGVYTALGAKANTADLGTAAAANVSTNGVTANEPDLVTGGQVQTAITNANTTALGALDWTQAATAGQVVTAITQTDGAITAVSTSDPLNVTSYAEETDDTEGSGTFVLTMSKDGSGNKTYKWEHIERASASN